MSRIHTPEGTARFVSILTPRQRKDSKGNAQGEPKYEITLIFDDKDELTAMRKEALAVGVEKFGTKFSDMVKKGKYLWPFKDNTEMVNEDDERLAGFENDDGVCVKFKTKDKPGIVDQDAEPIMDKADIYDGMRARVSCRAFAYDNESKGVAFFLINVQKLGDGERLSGDPAAEDDFKPVAKGKKPAAKGKSKASDVDDLL
jgi:hypothetical protein